MASTTILLLLAFAGMGEGLKCYVGVPGTSMTEQECKGSCITASTTSGGQTQTAVSCSDIHQADQCMTAGQAKTCFCNTDLCNKGSSSEPTKAPPPKPSGASGMRAQLALYFLCIGVVIGKLVLLI